MPEQQKNINTEKVLDYYGAGITKHMRGILKTKGKRATGRLINSIDYEVFINENKKEYLLDVTYAGYGQFVAGRNRENEPGHPPTWKGKGPPVKAIRQWLMAKNIPYKNYKGKKPPRNVQIDRMAYAIIKTIKRRKKLNPLYNNPTDFIKPYDETIASKKFKTDLGKALAKDGINQIKVAMRGYESVTIKK